MKFRLFANCGLIGNCAVAAISFGVWQDSVIAGCFALNLMGFVLSAINFFKSNSKD